MCIILSVCLLFINFLSRRIERQILSTFFIFFLYFFLYSYKVKVKLKSTLVSWEFKPKIWSDVLLQCAKYSKSKMLQRKIIQTTILLINLKVHFKKGHRHWPLSLPHHFFLLYFLFHKKPRHPREEILLWTTPVPLPLCLLVLHWDEATLAPLRREDRLAVTSLSQVHRPTQIPTTAMETHAALCVWGFIYNIKCY